MASTSAIPNFADDDAAESTLVGPLAPEDTLVGTLPKAPDALAGTLPKAPGIQDDEDDTALDSTLVGDPWDRTDTSSRPSEVRALRPTARASVAPPPRPGRESVTPRPKSVPAKPVAAKAAAKPTVPRASTKEKEKVQPKPVALAPPPVPAPTNETAKPEVSSLPPASLAPTPASLVPPPPPLPALDHTAPFPSAPTTAPVVASVETEADDDASFRRLSASPMARMAELLFAMVLFVGYLCRALVEGLVGACRPLWARASRDAAARVYRR